MSENYINNNFNLTLVTAVNNINTTLIVSSAVTIDGGFRILIESELLLVTSGGLTTSWTVIRGIEGTTGNAHGATVSINIVLTAGALKNLLVSGWASFTVSSGTLSNLVKNGVITNVTRTATGTFSVTVSGAPSQYAPIVQASTTSGYPLCVVYPDSSYDSSGFQFVSVIANTGFGAGDFPTYFIMIP